MPQQHPVGSIDELLHLIVVNITGVGASSRNIAAIAGEIKARRRMGRVRTEGSRQAVAGSIHLKGATARAPFVSA